MKPLAEGVESPGAVDGAAAACAERICAASEALCAWSASTSWMNEALSSRTVPSASRFRLRTEASASRFATSWSRTVRCSAVRAAITFVVATTRTRMCFVRSRVIRIEFFASRTRAAIRSSWRPMSFRNSIWSSRSAKFDAARTNETASGRSWV
jgi:hypothetical protein